MAAAGCGRRCARARRGARDRRRRLQRRLHRARDLRRRRQRDPGRGSQDRRRQGRHGRVGHAHAAGQGGGRAQHRKPRLPGLPRRRQLQDPPAVADRREVRRLPADAAARGRRAAAAAAEADPAGPGRRGRATCCRSPTRTARSTSTCSATSTRLPERERFTIILNELGAGLAGRGRTSTKSSRRANPALQELEKVLSILAEREQRAERPRGRIRPRRSRRLRPIRGQLADFIARARRSRRRAPRPARIARPEPRAVPGVPRTARPGYGTARALRRTDDRRRSPTSASRRRGSTRRSRACPRSRSPQKPSSRPRPDREGLGPRAERHANRCSNAARASASAAVPFAEQPLRAARRACAKPAVSSGCSTSSSSAPAPPTAMTRSATSCARRAWQRLPDLRSHTLHGCRLQAQAVQSSRRLKAARQARPPPRPARSPRARRAC